MEKETTANVVGELQIKPGRVSCLTGEGDSGEVYLARSLAVLSAESGRKTKYVAVGASDAAGELEGIVVISEPSSLRVNLALESVASGDLGRNEGGTLSRLLDGAEFVIIESFRAAVGTADVGACYRALASIEQVSRAKNVAVVVLVGSSAPELHDALGSVIVVRRGERKPGSRVHRVEQVQQPREAFEGARPTFLVLEQRESGHTLCRIDSDGLTVAEREQRVADAEIVMQAILDRPGSHLAAFGAGVDSDRAKGAVDLLVSEGRVSARGDKLCPDLWPSAAEVAKRAGLDARVLACITRYPDIALSTLPQRLKHAANEVHGAVERLRKSEKVRMRRNKASEACFVVESVAKFEDAFAQVRKAFLETSMNARDAFRYADLESVEQAQKMIDMLLERGEIEIDDTFVPPKYRLDSATRFKTAVARVRNQLALASLDAYGAFRAANLESVEQAEKALGILLQQGEIELDRRFESPCYRLTERPQPPAAA